MCATFITPKETNDTQKKKGKKEEKRVDNEHGATKFPTHSSNRAASFNASSVCHLILLITPTIQ